MAATILCARKVMTRTDPFISPPIQPAFQRLVYLCLALSFVVWASPLRAAEPTVVAAFAPSTTEVGNPVQLRVEINGAASQGRVPEIHLDGLEIQYVGPNSTELEFNGNRISITDHIYQVTPRRAGIFTIPSLAVEVDGRTIQTHPVVLNVQNSAAPSNDGGLDPVGRSEIRLAKKTAYIGEAVPVEIRVRVDSRIRWDLESMPDLEGDGYTKEKMPKPRGERERIDGREYDVVIFRTTITPSRAGTITIGPCEVHYRAQIPRARSNRSRNAFGNPLDSLLDNPLFAMGTVEEKIAAAEAVTLEVKQLPITGRPADFSGAIGQFKLTADGNPKAVKIGDPITMKLTVTGNGSLDRVGSPALPDPIGWRTYPPSSRTLPDDESGMKGSKIFEQAIIPTSRQLHLPIYQFSYFDPKLEKYVTLRSEPLPIRVDGEPLATPPPVAKATPADQPATGPKTAAPLPAPTDITGIRYEFGTAQSFEPLYRRLGFLLGQLVPALGLGGLAFARYWRPNRAAQRQAQLRRERSALLSALRKENEKSAFYAAAVRVFQLQAAMATGRAPETIDAAAVRRLLPEDKTSAIDEIFESQAASLYAGAANGSESLSASERERILSAVSELEKSKTLS